VPSLSHAGAVSDSLQQLMQQHISTPFPASITKGDSYGEVEPVMVGADVYGWALGVARGTPLDDAQRRRLEDTHGALLRSMPSFPDAAQPYYELLAQLAVATLAHQAAT